MKSSGRVYALCSAPVGGAHGELPGFDPRFSHGHGFSACALCACRAGSGLLQIRWAETLEFANLR